MKYLSKESKGFSLVEVMIAVVVLAIGLLGLAKFQVELTRSVSATKDRSAALALSERKLEDLRAFSQVEAPLDAGGNVIPWNNGVDIMAYDYIANDQGGRLSAAPYATGSGATLNLSWVVGAVPVLANAQEIVVTVGWTDQENQPQLVQLTSIISETHPGVSSPVNGDTGLTFDDPVISYTPGIAPETVWTDMGDGVKRESTAPEITVSQNNQFTEYNFKEVTYNNNNEILRVEELREINCVCELQATDSITFLPATIELSKDETSYINSFDVDTRKVVAGGKKWGARATSGQLSQQSESCDICCRDHHDKSGVGPDDLFDPFRPVADYDAITGDHNHYYPNNQGNLVLADGDGDLYLEACNLISINGIWRVSQDLNLLTIKSMPEAYLLGSGFNEYQTYKTDYLTEYVKQLDEQILYPAQNIGAVGDSLTPSIKYLLNAPSSAKFIALANEPDLDIAPYGPLAVTDTVNLRAKTIYARYISSPVLAKLSGLVNASTVWGPSFSNLLPFYDPDGTNIAQTGDDTSAWGTTAPLEISVDQNGVLTAISATDADGEIASATRTDSTTSFTNTRSIDPNDADILYTTSDEIIAIVSGSLPPSSVNVKVTVKSSVDAGVNPNAVSVVGASGAICGLEANNVKFVHICSFSGGAGKIVISDYNDSYKVNPGNITVIVNNEVCLSGATIIVVDDGTETETSTVIYSGLTDPVVDKALHIALQPATGSDCP